jgi:DNA (cytosine-5)-methyltransferase 1
VDWGEYTAAIGRWAGVLGRPAPYPTEPGRAGRPRLAAVFVEWLMGLPPGWVTDVPGISRSAQLRALGNGVIPAQAATALTLLLGDVLADPQARSGEDVDGDAGAAGNSRWGVAA